MHFNTLNRKHATRGSNRSTRDFRLWKRVSLASKCPGRWPRRKTNRPNQNALPVPCSQHHSLGLAISARCIRKAFQRDSMNKVGNIFFFRTDGGTSNSAKSHWKTRIQYLAGKVYSVQLYLGFVGRKKTTILWSLLKCPCRLDFSTHNPKANLASSGFWWVTLCRLATYIARVFISESRSWLTAASIWSCFVAARGRAMLFKICSLSDSLLALAVTISTSKPFLDWNELKCNKKTKKNLCRSGGNTLHKTHKKMNTQRPQTTNLYVFHEFSSANFHPTDPELLICFVHFGNTETKLSSSKICLGNFASRCDLAKKPKNGISCCSLSDRPSVMTWAVAPSSSVAARSSNKVLPAFP